MLLSMSLLCGCTRSLAIPIQQLQPSDVTPANVQAVHHG